MKRLFFVLFSAIALSTCATSKEAEAPADEGAEEEVVGPPEVAWADLTRQQRGRYMMKVVVPKMRDLFRSFDPEHFAKFNCSTCHGSGAKDKTFKMPSDIVALPATEEAFQVVMKEKPEMVKFMAEQVVPQMAALLGTHPFDPQKPEAGGFSCMNCHPAQKGEAGGHEHH